MPSRMFCSCSLQQWAIDLTVSGRVYIFGLSPRYRRDTLSCAFTFLRPVPHSPDVLVPLDVDLVELSRDGRDEVLLHLHRHVLRQHGEQEPLLKENNKMGISFRSEPNHLCRSWCCAFSSGI